MQVKCWDCDASYEVPQDMEHSVYSVGLIKRRYENDTTSQWMGLCELHKRAHARAADPSAIIELKRALPATPQSETRRILLVADELREHDLNLTRIQAIHIAVDMAFSPERESDPGFRAFLTQRETL